MRAVRKMLVGGVEVGGGRLILVSGPCVIEDEASCCRLAERLARMTSGRIPLVFKASYDKANRLSIDSFRGPGLEKGLAILRKVKEVTGLPVTTDVHCQTHVGEVASAVDLVQIPAYLCRQTDLTVAAGRTGKPVSLKKGQFMAPAAMKHVVAKVVSTGNRNVLLVERGTCFGYNRLVSDMRSLPEMRGFGYPVLFDAGHSVQEPGSQGDSSGGQRQMIPVLARAAVAAGCDGIFVEVHEAPAQALCDGPNSLSLSDLDPLIDQLRALEDALGEHRPKKESP